MPETGQNGENKKWRLSYGIHRGTLTSRDTGESHLDSLQACKDYIAAEERFLTTIGYMIWYAYAVPPGGTYDKDKIRIHRGNDYRS